MSKRFQIIGHELVITLNLKQPKRSKSGKSWLVASTRGPRDSGIRIKGQIVRVSANAFILINRNNSTTPVSTKAPSNLSSLKSSKND